MRRNEFNQIVTSWSGIQKFLSCQRQAELYYLENIQLAAERENLMIGSAFHEGIEAYTLAVDEDKNDPLSFAITAALAYIDSITEVGKKIHDYEQGMEVEDRAYYALRDSVYSTVKEMLHTYIPIIGIGDRFTPVNLSALLPVEVEPADEFLAVEVPFTVPVTEDFIFRGKIDAIFWDNERDEHVIIDWKTRGSGFTYSDLALLDNQLHAYAYALSLMGIKIRTAYMYQFRTTTPKEAVITKTGKLSQAAQQTTWEVWYSTLPQKYQNMVDSDEQSYREWAAEKLHTLDSFMQVDEIIVTEESLKTTKDNLINIFESMEFALERAERDIPMPAVLSSHHCRFCDYKRLCGEALRYGGDPQPVIEEFYKEVQEIEEDLDA